jgi:RNA polymerase sigma-70 factor (ECF subfamily)
MPTREELKPHQAAYKQFLSETDALRPDLYRYCRHLSANVWDAEDLVQETLLRSYAKLGWTYFQIADWRAYLFRTATNLWLNEQRRSGRVVYSDAPPELYAADDEKPSLAGDIREALLLLVEILAPQERIALVLKEVFDLPLSEIATHLQTSTGAVKNALHRAREKLSAARVQKKPSLAPPPRPAVLDAFVEAFNAHSVEKIVALLREDATASVVGLVQENNREDIKNGSLPHTVSPNNFAKAVAYKGEWLVVIGSRKEDSDELAGVGDVLRFATAGDKIVDITYYYFTLDMLKELLGEMNLPADLCDVYWYK